MSQEYHLANNHYWQRYNPTYEIVSWDGSLTQLEKLDPKQFEHLTKVRMAEEQIKLGTSEFKLLKTYGRKGNKFDLQVVTDNDRPLYFHSSYARKLLSQTGLFENLTWQSLMSLYPQERDLVIKKWFKRNDPITLMVNRDGVVGGVGTDVAEGIFTVPIIKIFENKLFETINPDDLTIKAEFLGVLNGVRIHYQVKEPMVIPGVGDVSSQILITSTNDFEHAFKIISGMIRIICSNGMYVGNPYKDDEGNEIDPFVSIVHKTPFNKVEAILSEKIDAISRGMSLTPSLLEKTTSQTVTLEDAKLFCHSLRDLPKSKGLQMHDRLIRALYGIYHSRNPPQLTLYDVIEKITEVGSDKSPLYRDGKHSDTLLRLRFLASEALRPDLFQNECQKNRELIKKQLEKKEKK